MNSKTKSCSVDQENKFKTGEMAQRLRVCAALAGDVESVPGTLMGAHNNL